MKEKKKTNELEGRRLSNLYTAIVKPRHVESSVTLREFIKSNYDDIKYQEGNKQGIIENVNVDRIRRRGINRIVNVYQLKYKNDNHVTGLGDFIRGCFYILYTCEMCDISCNIFINHPISSFLKTKSDNSCYPEQILDNVKMFVYNNCEDPQTDINNQICITFDKSIKSLHLTFVTKFLSYLMPPLFITSYIHITQFHKNIKRSCRIFCYQMMQ